MQKKIQFLVSSWNHELGESLAEQASEAQRPKIEFIS